MKRGRVVSQLQTDRSTSTSLQMHLAAWLRTQRFKEVVDVKERSPLRLPPLRPPHPPRPPRPPVTSCVTSERSGGSGQTESSVSVQVEIETRV